MEAPDEETTAELLDLAATAAHASSASRRRSPASWRARRAGHQRAARRRRAGGRGIGEGRRALALPGRSRSGRAARGNRRSGRRLPWAIGSTHPRRRRLAPHGADRDRAPRAPGGTRRGGEPLIEGDPGDSVSARGRIEAAAGGGGSTLAPLGRHFDAVPILVVTDGAVGTLGEDRRRLRPNVVVEGVHGLAERNWVGRRLRLGTVELSVRERCERCVMTTIDPDTLEIRPDVLRRINSTSRGRWACTARWRCPAGFAWAIRSSSSEGRDRYDRPNLDPEATNWLRSESRTAGFASRSAAWSRRSRTAG